MSEKKLSLKEKQAIASLDFDWSVRRIKENCGFEVKFELDAESFAGNLDAIHFVDSRGAVVVANAFASIADDALGKGALQEWGISKVLFSNTPKDSQRKFTVEQGTFRLSHAFDADGLPGYYDEGSLKKDIENSL